MYKDPLVCEKAKKLAEKNFSEEDINSEIEALHRQEERFVHGMKVAEQLTNFVNRMGNNDEIRGFVAGMERSHRTLQQSAFGLFLAWAYKMAKLPEGWYDLRNEASIKASKKIVEALGEYGDNLPFI